MKGVAEQIYLKTLLLISVGLVLGTLGGYVDYASPLFDLISHFKIHLLILAIILMVPAHLSRNFVITICVLLSLLLNIYEVVPWYFGKTQVLNEKEALKYTEIKLLTSNVKFNNISYQSLANLIKEENPDIVFLQELNKKWIDEISILNKSYSYSLIDDPKNQFGVAILSKTRLTEKEVITNGKFNTPSLIANTKINGKIIQLITLHPNPPISKDLLSSRNGMFEELEETVKRSKHPVVMGGDFNTTMWSPIYKKLVKSTGLKNTRKGFGMQGTWPVGEANYKNFVNIQNGEEKGTDLIPKWVIEKHPIKLPIDHVLVSPEIVVQNMEAGQNINSDHLPIITELLIPKN